ncbi:MAG: hypothetical protein WCO20_10955 [Holophagaceae bacterium]
MPDPQADYARLLERLRPGSARRIPVGESYEPPAFTCYEDIRTWLTDSVMTATIFERFPDGRWTIELMLKEQTPGPMRIIVL